MNSNDNLPLIYFQELLESDKSKLLTKSFITDFVKNSGESNFEIDDVNGTIKYYGQFYDEDGDPQENGMITHDFKSYFEKEIDIEIKNSKNIINATISELARANIPSLEYLDLNKRILKGLILNAELHYTNFHFIKEKLSELNSFIESLMNIKNKESYLSYKWDSSDESSTFEQLSKLYGLLQNDYKLIETTESEFINAFTKGEVSYGIRWMDVGKNKRTNKRSLLYLINQLEIQNFIEDIDPNDYNKSIVYVFRDLNGEELKNVRQSKSDFKSNPIPSKKIDSIISQLV